MKMEKRLLSNECIELSRQFIKEYPMNGKYYYYAPTYHAYDNVKGHAKM